MLSQPKNCQQQWLAKHQFRFALLVIAFLAAAGLLAILWSQFNPGMGQPAANPPLSKRLNYQLKQDPQTGNTQILLVNRSSYPLTAEFLLPETDNHFVPVGSPVITMAPHSEHIAYTSLLDEATIHTILKDHPPFHFTGNATGPHLHVAYMAVSPELEEITVPMRFSAAQDMPLSTDISYTPEECIASQVDLNANRPRYFYLS